MSKKVFVLVDSRKGDSNKVVDWILDDGQDSFQRALTTQHLINTGRDVDYPNCIIQEIEIDGEFNDELNIISIFSVNGVVERFVVNQLGRVVNLYNTYKDNEKNAEYPREFGFKMENYHKKRGVVVG